MPKNSTKILLLLTLVSGMFISISSNSWLGVWMGLEINLLSFIPLMTNTKNMFTAEASLKYFLVQAIASSVLIFIIIYKIILNSSATFLDSNNFLTSLISIPLMFKGGAAPLHWWFPSVMEGLDWMNCFVLMTVQKISPMVLISYILKFNILASTFILTSVIVGAVGGFNQTSTRKIMTYSSINHMGWMLSAVLIGMNLWLIYFGIYLILTLSIIIFLKNHQMSFVNQSMSVNLKPETKFIFLMGLLSLGGLPPFLGFLPKWIIIQSMIMNNLSLITVIMIISSLITLYFYLRICYSSFLIYHHKTKWTNWFHKNNMSLFSTSLSTISLLGLILSTALMNMY
uniref:NADH dehydrogenase subunit 2 n=1 Tax=Ergaula nepalensis TaxID=3037040 RepID=UPI0027A34DCC|nr:NADH dehydrogenase subunit 2 [Ergaula nepalensis]WGO57860.1 NADH dehydrogenase subunit 2 [Ergaula nepalensis]